MAMSTSASRDDRAGTALKGAPHRGIPVADPAVNKAGPAPAQDKFDAFIAEAVAAAPRLTAAQIDEVSALFQQAAEQDEQPAALDEEAIGQLGLSRQAATRPANEPKRPEGSPVRDQRYE